MVKHENRLQNCVECMNDILIKCQEFTCEQIQSNFTTEERQRNHVNLNVYLTNIAVQHDYPDEV